jgi:hypothetical protein
MILRSLLLLLVAMPAWAQVALVTDLKGKADSVAILSEIHADTTVNLQGELAVLYYASGDEYRFKGPATISFGGSGPKVLKGAPAERMAVEPKRTAALQPGGVAPATYVMRQKISAEQRARIEAARPAPDAPFSRRVAFAAWLEQLGLKDEARVYWKQLAGERPDSEQLKKLSR